MCKWKIIKNIKERRGGAALHAWVAPPTSARVSTTPPIRSSLGSTRVIALYQPSCWWHFRPEVKVCVTDPGPEGPGGGLKGVKPVAMASQRHTDTGVFEADGEDALVDLVKLHQLQEVDEQSETVVHGEVLPAAILALQRGGGGGGRRVRCCITQRVSASCLRDQMHDGNSQESPGSVWSSAGNTESGRSTVHAAGSL